MAETVYRLNQAAPSSRSAISTQDANLSNEISLPGEFNSLEHFIEVEITSPQGTRLQKVSDYRGAKELGDSASAGKKGTGVLYIDPVQDSISFGYINGNVTLTYNFLNSLLGSALVIKEISSDRTEIKVRPLVEDYDATSEVQLLQKRLQEDLYFDELFLDFNTDRLVGVNIALADDNSILVKLYSALPITFQEKSIFRLLEEVANPIAFNVSSTYIPDAVKVNYLKGPNFDVEVDEALTTSTEFLNYNELYNYPVTSSYHQTLTLLSGSDVRINVDFTDYQEFIHFSSAYERLANFKYKLDLIHSYEAEKLATGSLNNVATAVTESNTRYDNLITGIISKFDNYEQYLYFYSGSKAWPKSTSTKPYLNLPSSDTAAQTWFNSEIVSASLYDELNESRLTYTVPEFIRQDASNAPYSLFLDMIGQHFDNLWIYAKGVTDKYDADNRLTFGISRDFIESALKSFGVKLYSSNFSTANLASMLIGEWYDSGSEQITTFVTASNEPTADSDILHETYKRLYHNLPYLIKTKGTERGLRALINTFGIPSGSLEILTFGGVDRSGNTPYFASNYPTADKIRLHNTGSIVNGDTLSQYVSIQKTTSDLTQDRHIIEAGFSPAYNIDEYIVNNITGSFNIDQYIGDPTSVNYSELNSVAETLLSSSDAYDVFDYVRLIKFFDNQLFKMVKDFVPARDVATSGIIIKPHILDRSKVKGTEISYTRPEYSASIDTAFISGSNSGVVAEHSTAHTASIITPVGNLLKINNTEVESFNGEFGGTLIDAYSGSLNEGNIFKQFSQQPLTYDLVEYLDQDSPTLTEYDFLTQLPVLTGKMYMFHALNTKYGYHYLKYIFFRNTSDNGIDVKEAVRAMDHIIVNGVRYNYVDKNITNATTLLTLADPGGGYFKNPSAFPTTEITVDVIIVPFFTRRFDNSDYNAILNNAFYIANKGKVQRIDYSTNPLTPVNLNAILTNTAEPADMQEYVHNSAGYVRGRYIGHQLQGAVINKYTVGDSSYGKTPVVESTTPYFCIFDYISGFSPEHNKANAIVISYIVDEEGNFFTPDSPQALHILKQGFTNSSKVELSIKSANIGGSEAQLLGEQEILRGGARIEPILYSYTAATYLQPTYSTTAKLEFELPNPAPDTYDFAANGTTIQTLGNTVGTTTTITFPNETKDDKNFFSSNTYTLTEDTEQRIKFTFNGLLSATGYNQPGGYYTSGTGIIKILYCTDNTFAANKTTTIGSQTIQYNDFQDQDIDITTSLGLYNSGSAFKVVVEVNSTFDTLELYTRQFNGMSEYSGSSYINVTGSFTTGSNSTTVLTGSQDLSGKYGMYFKGISGSASPGFNNVTHRFEPQIGDEIKFNNDEDRAYLITKVETPSQNISEKLYLTLDKPLRSSDNINFYALRRYIDASNMVLMKTDKVAGTQSNGILYPLYPSPRLAKNYENIISNLKSKSIL